MASIVLNKSGTRRIQYMDNGKRQSIPLGKKATKKQAQTFQLRIEHLLTARFTVMDDETARWVAKLPADMHSMLVAKGLVEPRIATEETEEVLLAEFVASYITTKAVAVKPRTVLVWRQAQQSLLDFFGPDKVLADIHEGDAEMWWLSMVKENLAEATRRKRAQNAKQFMQFAIKHKRISSNPFSELKSSAVANEKRLYQVTPEHTQRCIDACPCD